MRRVSSHNYFDAACMVLCREDLTPCINQSGAMGLLAKFSFVGLGLLSMYVIVMQNDDVLDESCTCKLESQSQVPSKNKDTRLR